MKKAFTLIELVVVIALISILSVTLGPKVLAQINKSKVSRVLDTLSNLQTKLSILQVEQGKDIESVEEFNFLLDKRYSTLAFGNIEESSEIYTVRTNLGGWLYNLETFTLEANLPNGAYTGDSLNEIWSDVTGVVIDYGLYNDGSTPINTGDGDDIINIEELTSDAQVLAGAGNDIINIDQTRRDSKVDTGQGDDTINIDRLRGNSALDSGEGNDIINIGELKFNTTIDSGQGNDNITIDKVSNNFDTGSVGLGSGDDTLTINDSLSGKEGTFNGGDGNNTLNLSEVTVDQWNNGISDKFENFGTVNLKDGTINN